MPAAVRLPSARCPSCRAEVRPTDPFCWLCGTMLSENTVTAEAIGPPRKHPQHDEALMLTGVSALVITVVIVLIGVYLTAPGVGIVLAVVLVPITIHIVVLTVLRMRYGHAVHKSDILAVIGGWVGVAIMVFVFVPALTIGALVIALLVICSNMGSFSP